MNKTALCIIPVVLLSLFLTVFTNMEKTKTGRTIASTVQQVNVANIGKYKLSFEDSDIDGGDYWMIDAIMLTSEPYAPSSAVGASEILTENHSSIRVADNRVDISGHRVMITSDEAMQIAKSLAVDESVLVVDSVNNRVGVGTSEPGAMLHVSGGDVYFSGTSPYGFRYDDTNGRVGPRTQLIL